jgi:hypothetical protein
MADESPLRGPPKGERRSPFGKTTERIQRPAKAAPIDGAALASPPPAVRLPSSPPVGLSIDGPWRPAGTPMYDAVAGERALTRVMPRLNALSAERLERPRGDVELVAAGALRVARSAGEPPLRARFRALPPSEFDPECLDLLEPLAWALWHVHRAQRAPAATTAAAAAVVPVELVEAATELERRMQNCVEYHLADHPEAGPTVAFLRAGTGYRDLAGDLLGYAELYRTHREELRHDRKHYREGDADEAVRLATRLFEALALGQGGDRHGLALRDRAWTLFARAYDEVAATGRWLLRRESGAASTFPTLRALGRSTPAPPGAGGR